MQIGKRVIVHGLVEIDRVENLDSVICMHKCMANLEQGRTFRKRFVNTEIRNSLKNDYFYDKLIRNYRNHFLTY